MKVKFNGGFSDGEIFIQGVFTKNRTYKVVTVDDSDSTYRIVDDEGDLMWVNKIDFSAVDDGSKMERMVNIAGLVTVGSFVVIVISTLVYRVITGG